MASKAMAAYERGNAHLNKGEYDLAIACYSEAIKLDPTLANAYHMRGNAYFHKSNYDRAIANYDESCVGRTGLTRQDASSGYMGRMPDLSGVVRR
jgi:tetratricopeptide (TPR) repeat protein